MDLHLIFHNIGFTAGAIIALIMAVLVYLKDRHAVQNVTFSVGFLFITIFCVTHVIGVNIYDPSLSRAVLMGNLSVIFITCCMAHCSFALAGILHKHRFFLAIMYTTAVVLTCMYLLFPETYLLLSHPKMYFPNYYVAGDLQWVMRIIFDVVVPVYFMVALIISYRSADAVLRNRLWYFLLANILGYMIGSMAILLVYDIPVDPVWAALFVPILALPMGYAIIRYNLMDIRVVAKRALVFAIVVACASFSIFLVGYINYTLTDLIPKFPGWIMPMVGGILAAIIGFMVWNKFRESDQLKYEFITTIIHKFRTPLTSINWLIENMSSHASPDIQSDLRHMKESSEKLAKLTDVIMNASSEDKSDYSYNWQVVDLNNIWKDVIKYDEVKAKQKNIQVTLDVLGSEFKVEGDLVRLQSVFEVLLNNALEYSAIGGFVAVSLMADNHSVITRVTDTGIGMDKEEMSRIFSRFYRTTRARSIDTEGLGIGLSLAKNIIERHGGKIKVHSDGPDKGTTFLVTLPSVSNK